MASVVLAVDERGYPVAVKIAHPETADVPALRALFEAEAAAARGPSYPHLVRCLATTEDPLAMVLDYVDGPSLDALLDAGRLPDASVAALVVSDIAAGLWQLEREGKAHGDLCPRNVLVGRDGMVKLTDYGAAAVAPGFVGTAGYAAPELVRGTSGGAIDRADLFSLGVLLWELLRGERLFDAPTEALRLVATVERVCPAVALGRPELLPFVPLVSSLLATTEATRPTSSALIVSALAPHLVGGARVRLAEHVDRVFVKELAQRDALRKAVAPPYPDR